MTHYYPIFLAIKGRKCVVIGGGKVAERKIVQLLHSEANVTTISPSITKNIEVMVKSGKVEWINRQYRKGDLYGAFLAIAATNNRRINLRVSIEATKCNTILNVIDDTPLCAFIAPSIINKGDVTVAISTGGTSPALARKLRHLLENSPQLEYACLSQIMGLAREKLSKEEIRVSPDHWQTCVTQDLVDLVKSGNQQQALDILVERLISEASPIVEFNHF